MRSRRTLFRETNARWTARRTAIRNPLGARVLDVYSGGSYRWTRRLSLYLQRLRTRRRRLARAADPREERGRHAGPADAEPGDRRVFGDRWRRPRRHRRSRAVESLVRVSGFRLDRPVGARTGMVAAAGPAAAAARRSHDAQGGQDRRVGSLPKRTVSCSGRLRPRAPAFLQPSPRPCLARLFL